MLIVSACLCSAFRAQAEAEPAARPIPDDERVTASVNAFGFKLYERMAAQPGNIAISPWSVESVLVIAWAGAAGRTERQMTAVLGLAGDPGGVDAAFAAQAKKVLSHRGKSVVVAGANAAWIDQAAEIQPLFLGRIRAGYGADVLQADFIQSNEVARLSINRWVAKRTRNRIEDLIQPGLLDEMTRMVLVNTLYFNPHFAFKLF